MLLGVPLMAQKQLRVEYELTVSEENFQYPELPLGIDINVPKQYFELTLDDNESLWKKIDVVDNKQIVDGAIISFPPSGTLYKNLKEKIKIEEVEAYSKNYLVKDSLVEINWKIENEYKEIIKIKTRKATFFDKKSETKLIAWYASELNFKNGAYEYWGLPGLVLEIELTTYYDDNSKDSSIYSAIKVETLKKNKKLIPPTKGTIVNSKELDKIQQTNFERMIEIKNQGVGVDKD